MTPSGSLSSLILTMVSLTSRIPENNFIYILGYVGVSCDEDISNINQVCFCHVADVNMFALSSSQDVRVWSLEYTGYCAIDKRDEIGKRGRKGCRLFASILNETNLRKYFLSKKYWRILFDSRFNLKALQHDIRHNLNNKKTCVYHKLPNVSFHLFSGIK